VAIIGILVTLLLPSLDRAREAAKRAVCLSNLAQQARWSLIFSVDHNKKIPLQYHSHAERNSSYLKIHNKFQNAGVLYDLEYFGVEAEDVLKCPSSDSPKDDWWLDDDSSIETTDQHVLSHYSTRPITQAKYGANEGSLVPLYKYADKALISEYLYGRHKGKNGGKGFQFHTQGNAVAYGAGHAKFIWDRDGTEFLNRLFTDNSDNWYYKPNSDGEVTSGIWWILDQDF
jgi:hypothetical protein